MSACESIIFVRFSLGRILVALGSCAAFDVSVIFRTVDDGTGTLLNGHN